MSLVDVLVTEVDDAVVAAEAASSINIPARAGFSALDSIFDSINRYNLDDGVVFSVTFDVVADGDGFELKKIGVAGDLGKDCSNLTGDSHGDLNGDEDLDEEDEEDDVIKESLAPCVIVSSVFESIFLTFELLLLLKQLLLLLLLDEQPISSSLFNRFNSFKLTNSSNSCTFSASFVSDSHEEDGSDEQVD